MPAELNRDVHALPLFSAFGKVWEGLEGLRYSTRFLLPQQLEVVSSDHERLGWHFVLALIPNDSSNDNTQQHPQGQYNVVAHTVEIFRTHGWGKLTSSQ